MIETGQYQQKLTAILQHDPFRLDVLDAVSTLGLPQCYVSAGFVRNMVWDALHGYQTRTPLNDVDVIYFSPDESEEHVPVHEKELSRLVPVATWQVKNQAFMHIRNNHTPYTSTLDAMGYWPEKETAVAVRKLDDNSYEWLSAFGFESLFSLHLTYNPQRELSLFEKRVERKQWLKVWPLLTMVK